MRPLTGWQFKNMVKGSGLTMKQVCEEALVSPTAVSSWASGKQDILLNTYDRLIIAYEQLRKENENS